MSTSRHNHADRQCMSYNETLIDEMNGKLVNKSIDKNRI